MGGTDLDGNGRMDLVLYPGTGRPVQVWMNDPQKGWEVQELPDLRPLRLIDLDHDGDLDIWSYGDDTSRFFVSRFLYNDGDVDLVMFDSFVAVGGGVHVLLNRLAEGITAVEETQQVVPTQSHLGAAYPNPFNPGVVVPFTLGPAAAKVSLTVYNILGQEVRKLGLGELPAGVHQVAWDGRGEGGRELVSGVYLYRLQAGLWSATGKLVKSE